MLFVKRPVGKKCNILEIKNVTFFSCFYGMVFEAPNSWMYYPRMIITWCLWSEKVKWQQRIEERLLVSACMDFYGLMTAYWNLIFQDGRYFCFCNAWISLLHFFLGCFVRNSKYLWHFYELQLILNFLGLKSKWGSFLKV